MNMAINLIIIINRYTLIEQSPLSLLWTSEYTLIKQSKGLSYYDYSNYYQPRSNSHQMLQYMISIDYRLPTCGKHTQTLNIFTTETIKQMVTSSTDPSSNPNDCH